MNSSFQRFQRQSWLIGSLALFIGLGWSKAVYAEGSKELIESARGQGDRPYLDYRLGPPTSPGFGLGGIPRSSTIKVYANPGETINLGSSATGRGGTINYRSPAGTAGTCGAGVGQIRDLNAEVAGSGGGYTPCTITVGAGQGGVWEIDFVSPNPQSLVDPPPIPVGLPWTQPSNVSYVAAWDVTVRNSGGTAIPGRAYANYLSLNLGSNGRSLQSKTFIQTQEGYLYRIDLKNLDPFGFIFFANNKGFRDPTTGRPIFSSINADVDGSGNSNNDNLVSPPRLHSPSAPDTPTDITHKIFFNQPDRSLPERASVRGGGTTWLLAPPVPIPNTSDFDYRFEGIDGTPNQAGPTLGGNFTFNASALGSYVITIDVNRDGVLGNGNDVVLKGQTTPGLNSIEWDGRDKSGNPLTAGLTPYTSVLTYFVGDVHFPFLDPESNPGGLTIERLNPVSLAVENSRVYYDDSSLPPIGGPTNPISALGGINSTPGVRGFSNLFGNDRGIDTWTSLADPVTLTGGILIQEADLSIAKTAPSSLAAGSSITYNLAVTSNQPPSDVTYTSVKGAKVTDTVPPQITGVSWACAITSGTGACGTASGTGNNIDLTVDLDVGAIATLTVNGTLSPSASGELTNTATVTRPPDVTDPNPNNNTSSAVTTVTTSPSPVANKSVRFLRDNDGSGNLTIGDDIEYKIVVRNPNAVPISNLVISDAIPIQWQVLRDASNPITVDSGFSLASPPALPSSSFVSTGNSVTFTNPGTLAPGATMTLTFNVRIRPGSPSPLINQGTINFQGDNGNPVLTDASDSTNPTGPGSDVNPGNPSPLNPDGSGGNVNQPNAGNADPTIIKFVSPITPTGTKSVRLVTDSDGSGAVTTGDTLEYTITYSNTSSSDVRDFLVTDSLDSNGLSFVSGSYSLSATGTGTTVAANPNYNGTTDTNLNRPGTLGRGGGQVVIKYRAVVLAAAGTKINNQARATSIGGNVNQSLTDALQGPRDLPQVLDDGINQGNLSDTGDDEPTGLTVGDVGSPRLRLVKRITSVTRSGVPISGINFSTFVDDPADDNDNAPGWSQLSPVGVLKLGSEVSLQSGDEVEYTIYFLSDGAQNSRNIKFCDLIPAGTTFIPDSLGPGIGIRLRQGGTQSDQTNASDTDQGIFYSPLTPVTAPCSDPKNPNGAVFLQLGNIPNTAPNNAGLVRFRVRID